MVYINFIRNNLKNKFMKFKMKNYLKKNLINFYLKILILNKFMNFCKETKENNIKIYCRKSLKLF